jgi:hypothetical protein
MEYFPSTFLNYPPGCNPCLQKTLHEKSEALMRTLLPKVITVKGASTRSLNEISRLTLLVLRRRNRTTQSCLNCHTSKRMVNRAQFVSGSWY